MNLIKKIFSIKNDNKHTIYNFLGIKIKFKIKEFKKTIYLQNRNHEIIIRQTCPLCDSEHFLLKNTYDINLLIERWKGKYAFIPIADCYKDKVLERRVCKNCGLNYYNYFLPDTNEFYQKLITLQSIYATNKFDYDEAINIVQQFRPETLLDIGCGYGYFLDKIKNYVKFVAGTEFNDTAIKVCKKKNINIYNSDLSQIDKKFDMITAFQVLEHVKDVKNFIKNSINRLNTGGVLLFVTPNPESELIKYNPGILELPPHHNLDISKEAFEYIAKEYNLQIIDYKKQDIDLYGYEIYLKSKYNINFDKSMYNAYLQEKNNLVGKSHLVCYKKL